MSDSINLVCKKCRQRLWIGQFPYREESRAFVYNTPKHSKLQARFFVAHMGHDLTVVNDALTEEMNWDDEEFQDFEDLDSNKDLARAD